MPRVRILLILVWLRCAKSLKRDWQKIGVVDQGDVQWNLMNGYRIPVSNLSESAIDYCLKVDGRFSKVDE